MGSSGTLHFENGNAVIGLASKVKRYPETGISILIVGSGIGGLRSAIECWRKGHSVQVLERSARPYYTGDNLTIQSSAMSVFRHWPELYREIEEDEYDCWMAYHKHTGEHIYDPSPPSFNDPENIVGRKGPHVAVMQSRVKFYKSLIRQTERLGLRIQYSKCVIGYYEDEDAGIGGVLLESGDRQEADVVIAADGIKTKSGKIISGEDTEAKESGMAIYRSAYPVEHALSEPLDDGTATESWSADVEPAEVLKVMEREAPGWHPAVSTIMKTAPKGTIIHWKLMWRDLCEKWTSPADRVVQVGDSAHSFLPSSGNGASQAMEDAITLATCLQLSGKSSVPTATKVYNKLRYQRVSCAQKMSFVNSQLKHQTPWPLIASQPSLIRIRFPRWIYAHDPEAYAYEKFGLAFNHVVSGGRVAFENENFPRGHRFRGWGIEEVKREIAGGGSMEALLDGDWS